VNAVQDVTALARRAASRGPLMERLCDNALHDPIPEVRIKNLEVLARDRKRGPKTLRAALADPNEDVRLRAALWLGVEGRPVLLELATNAATGDECAAEAIRGLRTALSEAQALEILEGALARHRHPVVRAAVEALGLSGTVVAVPHLRAVIESHPLDFAMKRAADGAIARIQSRLEGAEAGQLAVAEGDAGQLTLADSAAGRLSLDHTPRRSEPESA
jgi:HEAT repeat protein